MTRGDRATWVLVAICLVRALWPESRAVRHLQREGFPADYARRLAPLCERHPNWSFEPLPVDDMPWEAVIDRECSPGWNLVTSNSWAKGEWLKLGLANYTPYFAPHACAYDSGSWYQASREAVAYFMDPRNFLNDDEVFMFETIGIGDAFQDEECVERALAGSFMHDACYDGGTRKFAALLVDVGRETGLSAVFLANRLRLEQGNGTVQGLGKIGDSLRALRPQQSEMRRSEAEGRSPKATAKPPARARALTQGTTFSECNGIYNLFNIGACGKGLLEIRLNAWREAVSAETRERYGGPWTTQEKAIRGGAKKIKELYVDALRHTRYLQKFSVAPKAGRFRWKQYMQNIAAPLLEARGAAAAVRVGDGAVPRRFVVPVYRERPRRPAPDPAGGKSVYSSHTR